jgi:lysyl-tRNA synthetase class 2
MPKKPADNRPSDDVSDESVYDVRLKKLEALRKAGEEPYPATVKRTHTLAAVRDDFKKLEKSSKAVTVTGRLMTFRTHGKLSFATLRDESGDFQLAFQADTLGKRYDDIDELDMGDFVEATGTVFTTRRGEPTLSVTKYGIISKSLRALPEKWHGLKDNEERYRKRYLDMLANPEVREKLKTRSRLITAIRAELDRAGFLELENPVLEVHPSGAATRPMKTHLNAYDLDLHLRISIGELWQKRSLVGGFEKIYEIGRAFRNEGVDPSHHPDFTMLEYYWAYADYEDNLKFHEQLIPAVVKTTTGKLKVQYGDDIIDFKAPYPRKTFRDAIKESCGIDIAGKTRDELAKVMKAGKFKVDPKGGLGKLMDDLFKESFRKGVVQPIFITDHPIELSPLAKKNPDDPSTVQRFQLVVAGFELSNSYSELNDPIDQRERFAEQIKLQQAGDDEAMGVDDDFVEALEYGMPPATGTGIGIDRFAALLTDSGNIREVTAYPLMKPKPR